MEFVLDLQAMEAPEMDAMEHGGVSNASVLGCTPQSALSLLAC
ncbi:hypothetical protein LX15_002249 [Streptoalloteichus tenebrarius]|uniref:SapB/AmfS family lantipeptide n=1 Tax=Streptoalloteichus tenebrarius (strain ATCC 17920 / DSM 40477 / JCM 4838 / CBS 697.72 / NBRC 16177 / NCIMB 11028 / NRRL B-12390 / A12253. 1 / ISP 5477) TaxID=1933 RepID=A0ABT1HSQ0_STRSD|nr:SapB/AmfS family lanthipeptide [Streptoalloteichus tenebrarius]MCP2258551.1 hypothetical protein [Streptoalloteichus tenebrarius]